MGWAPLAIGIGVWSQYATSNVEEKEHSRSVENLGITWNDIPFVL
jgi:hypothetical protein